MQIVGLSGSFRSGSYNTKLLRFIGTLFDEDAEFVVVSDLDQLPFYAETWESALPAYAEQLRALVADADALIIASPEYNHSYTPVIKNAIDWLSRPYGAGSITRKPVALVGASPSLYGTIRAQSHLRQVLHGVDADLVTRPEIFVNDASSKFDLQGNLTDEVGVELTKALVARLYELEVSDRRLTA
jgi:chromate reductase